MGRNHIQIDNLSSLLKLLIDKQEMEVTAVDLIFERTGPPAEALPFLTYISSDPKSDGDMRLRAAISLARSRDPMALDMAMETSAVAANIGASASTKKLLHDTLLKNHTLENRYPALIEHGFSPNEPLGRYAWIILAEWLGGEVGSPSMKAQIKEAIKRAKADPAISKRLPSGL